MIFYIILFFYGLIIGFFDLIPGLSGSTAMYILNIYKKIIKILYNILRFNIKIEYVKYLLFIGLGMSFSYFIGSHLLYNFIISNHKTFYFLISGIIIFYSIYHLYFLNMSFFKKITYFILGIILFFILSTIISSFSSFFSNISFFKLFLAGFLGGFFMILPGMSGSYILLLLNVYPYILYLLKDLRLLSLFIFGVGVIFGILSNIILIKKFIDSNRKLFNNIILGFLFSSAVYLLFLSFH